MGKRNLTVTYWKFEYSMSWATFELILQAWPSDEPIRSTARISACREHNIPEHRAGQITCKLNQQLTDLPPDIKNRDVWAAHKYNNIRQRDYRAWSRRIK